MMFLIPSETSEMLAAAVPSPPDMPLWALPPVCLVLTAYGWWAHLRWRRGRRFTLGRPKSEMELWRVAEAGFVMLPSAVAGAAFSVDFGLWMLFGLPDSALSGYVFLAASAVGVYGGAWTFKERLWPSPRRAPQWVRDLGLLP